MRALILLAAVLAACGDSRPAAPDDGAAPAAATRIVTLAPHLTELAYAAGAGGRLVGTVAWSDFPEAARSLPRIGDAFRIDYEALAALDPDLVLGWRRGNPDAMLERLAGLGYRVIALETRRLGDIADQLERIGELAGSGQGGRAAAGEFRARLAALAGRRPGAAPVRVFYQVSARPLMTVSARHVIGQGIELCGGVNVFANLPGLAPVVALEAVLDEAPEAIIGSRYDNAGDVDIFAAWRERAHLPATARGALYRIDADYLSRPGTRILEGIEAICASLDDARALRAGRPGPGPR